MAPPKKLAYQTLSRGVTTRLTHGLRELTTEAPPVEVLLSPYLWGKRHTSDVRTVILHEQYLNIPEGYNYQGESLFVSGTRNTPNVLAIDPLGLIASTQPPASCLPYAVGSGSDLWRNLLIAEVEGAPQSFVASSNLPGQYSGYAAVLRTAGAALGAVLSRDGHIRTFLREARLSGRIHSERVHVHRGGTPFTRFRALYIPKDVWDGLQMLAVLSYLLEDRGSAWKTNRTGCEYLVLTGGRVRGDTRRTQLVVPNSPDLISAFESAVLAANS